MILKDPGWFVCCFKANLPASLVTLMGKVLLAPPTASGLAKCPAGRKRKYKTYEPYKSSLLRLSVNNNF